MFPDPGVASTLLNDNTDYVSVMCRLVSELEDHTQGPMLRECVHDDCKNGNGAGDVDWWDNATEILLDEHCSAEELEFGSLFGRDWVHALDYIQH